MGQGFRCGNNQVPEKKQIYDYHSDEWWTPRDDSADEVPGSLAGKIAVALFIILFLLAVVLK